MLLQEKPRSKTFNSSQENGFSIGTTVKSDNESLFPFLKKQNNMKDKDNENGKRKPSEEE